MRCLGKIVLFIFLYSSSVMASVDARVDTRDVTLGDSVTLNLEISGENIQEPNISSVCDSDVVATSTQTSIQMINGSFTKTYVLGYRFVPQKDCEIKPIEVNIDGKIEKSNSIKIRVGKPKQTKDANFMLSLSTNKKDLFVGEPFDVVLTFKQRRDAQAIDSKFVAPKLNGFWIKKETKPIRSKNNDFIITKVVYTMAAQRVGELEVTPAQIKIASRINSRDFWGSFSPTLKWKTYFSNSLKIKVNPLPNGVELIGSLKISATTDKDTINPNEAVNVVVKVQGKGNLEDIKSFKPFVNGVNVFDEKINIDNNILTQKLAFIGDENFTIPSFSLKFYNPNTQKIENISTKEIKIKVNYAKKAKEKLLIKKSQIEDKQEIQKISSSPLSNLWIIGIFIAGIVVGMLIMMLKDFSFSSKNNAKIDLKDYKMIFVKLLPYKEDKEVASLLESIEKNLYNNANIDIDKKILKDILKRYEIS